MNLSSLNPYLRRCWYHIMPANSGDLKTRIILDYELICIEGGSVNLEYNGKTYFCQAGDILLLCPGIPHSLHLLGEPLVQPHIHFDLVYDSLSPAIFVNMQPYEALSDEVRHLIRKNEFPQLANRPILTIQDPDTFRSIFHQILNHDSIHALSCKAWMLQLLEIILRDHQLLELTPEPPQTSTAAMVKAYIDEHFQLEQSLDQMAAHFSYSKFYLEKIFQQSYGTSVVRYRNQCRMTEALTLLQTCSVTETAQQLGFSSIYAFSRAFRTFYGYSPSQIATKKSHSE